jgi:hypothetical protein
MMLRIPMAVMLCGALGACTTIDASSDRGSATYFGIVHVLAPATETNAPAGSAPVSVSDASAFGLRIRNGIGVGYFHDQDYRIPPDCRVAIFVQNQQQLEQLARQLADFKEGICSAIKPS